MPAHSSIVTCNTGSTHYILTVDGRNGLQLRDYFVDGLVRVGNCHFKLCKGCLFIKGEVDVIDAHIAMGNSTRLMKQEDERL